MAAKWLDIHELNHQAFAVLIRELGVPETFRFLRQFGFGKGNYTEERRELLAGMTVEDFERELAKLPKRTEG